MTETQQQVSGERADILSLLAERRHFLRFTAQNLTDEQATTRSTASELTVGGLIKHVTDVEKSWQDFALGKAHPVEAMDFDNLTPEQIAAFQNGFRFVDGETLESVLAEHEKTAAATDELVRTLDLDTAYELPEAPWQPPGVFWTVRRVFLHIAGETAHHSGHADIIRETIDGQKSMG
ncbi:DinB family protein [Tsukamurella sp. 1534]|uniref:DinB family protein n=1 Tax=Tsukamurella sp. 1534 TaxID=1151061 RepID=UPI0002EAB62D|nr:DinB family protein [Tsukamurella sp. 1534]